MRFELITPYWTYDYLSPATAAYAAALGKCVIKPSHNSYCKYADTDVESIWIVEKESSGDIFLKLPNCRICG